MSRKLTHRIEPAIRDQRWHKRYARLEGKIQRLRAQLAALDDQRCDGCGKFEDDDSDRHSVWCRHATVAA